MASVPLVNAATPMLPDLTVVIVTHRRADLLARTLQSLGECRLPESFAGTIVIENGARAGAKEVIQEAAVKLRAEYLFEESSNKSISLNRAVDAVRDGLIVFFDDDVRVSPDVLYAYARAANGHEGGHYFVGPSDPDYEERPPQWLKRYLPASAVGVRADSAGNALEKLTFPGYNWAAFACDLRACGGFRTDLGAGEMAPGEDSQMQRDLQAHGVASQYVPAAMVWHYVPRNRCSPGWALHRVYRYGITMGMFEAQSHKRQHKALGLPRALQRKLRKRVPLADVWAALALSRRGRFAVRYHWAYVRGFIRGYRVGTAEWPLGSHVAGESCAS